MLPEAQGVQRKGVLCSQGLLCRQPARRLRFASDRLGQAVVRDRHAVALHHLVAHLDADPVGAAARLHLDHPVLPVESKKALGA